MLCLSPPVPSRQLRPFLPDRKLPQEQEFMVIGAREPRVFLRQWSNGPRQCQEFSFSTQLDCKLLEYRNLTHLQLLQPCLLQVELSYLYWFYVCLHILIQSIDQEMWQVNLECNFSCVSGPGCSHLLPPEHHTGCECVCGPGVPQYQPVCHPHCRHCPAQLATGNRAFRLHTCIQTATYVIYLQKKSKCKSKSMSSMNWRAKSGTLLMIDYWYCFQGFGIMQYGGPEGCGCLSISFFLTLPRWRISEVVHFRSCPQNACDDLT